MSNALVFAGVVGKYIRMERPATPEEVAAGDPATVGMECLVAQIVDEGPGYLVIVADYGMSFTIDMERFDEWSFAIWPDEATMKEFRR